MDISYNSKCHGNVLDFSERISDDRLFLPKVLLDYRVSVPSEAIDIYIMVRLVSEWCRPQSFILEG